MASRTQVSSIFLLCHPQCSHSFSSWLQESRDSSSHHILTIFQTQKRDHDFLVSAFKS